MNKADVVIKVSEQSGISPADCEKVLDAFERVLSDELANSNSISGALDIAGKLLSYFKSKK